LLTGYTDIVELNIAIAIAVLYLAESFATAAGLGFLHHGCVAAIGV